MAEKGEVMRMGSTGGTDWRGLEGCGDVDMDVELDVR